MVKTIFVGHTPNTYKVYQGLGENGINGWYVQFLGKDGNIRIANGGKIYKYRQNAYRDCAKLNHPIAHAIKKTGVCEAYWDSYTLCVREDENKEMEDIYTLSIGVGGMPPHFQQDFKTVEAVEEYIREESQFSLYLDWRKVETEG